MTALCKDGTMSLRAMDRPMPPPSISTASNGTPASSKWRTGRNWEASPRRSSKQPALTIPMMCCSPDFTHPDPAFRAANSRARKILDRHVRRPRLHVLPRPLRTAPPRSLPRGRHPLRRRVHRGLPPPRPETRRHPHHRKPLQRRLLGISRVRPARWTSSAISSPASTTPISA